MFGQVDMAGHQKIGLGLLLVVMTTAIAPAATADDITLVPLMTADGVGIALAVLCRAPVRKASPWSQVLQ